MLAQIIYSKSRRMKKESPLLSKSDFDLRREIYNNPRYSNFSLDFLRRAISVSSGMTPNLNTYDTVSEDSYRYAYNIGLL